LVSATSFARLFRHHFVEINAAAAGTVPTSPTPLAPERIEQRRRFRVDRFDHRQLRRRGKQIVGQVRRQGLTVVVVHDSFEHAVADAVDDAALGDGALESQAIPSAHSDNGN
jgi:hypothetical protein